MKRLQKIARESKKSQERRSSRKEETKKRKQMERKMEKVVVCKPSEEYEGPFAMAL